MTPTPKGKEKKENPYKAVHEKLVLEVDFDQRRLHGFAEIVILPLVPKLKLIGINCKSQVNVFEVLVNGEKAEYQFQEPPTASYFPPSRSAERPTNEIGLEHTRELRNYSLYLNERQDVEDLGELVVDLPLKVRDQLKEAGSAERDVDIMSKGDEDVDDLLLPIIVRVSYELVEPTAGVQFVLPHPELFPDRPPQCFSCTVHSSPSLWFPCLDNTIDRSTFELELTCTVDCMAVATGKLMKQLLASGDKKRIFVYRSDTPIMPRSVGFVVAPMIVYPDPTVDFATHFVSATPRASKYNSRLQKKLQHTVACFEGITKCFAEYLNCAYTRESRGQAYKMVFVDEPEQEILPFSGLSILSTTLLYDKKHIDQIYLTRKAVARSFAYSWLGSAICYKSPCDYWIIDGLVGYMVNVEIQRAFGTNEREWEQLMDHLTVVSKDLRHFAEEQQLRDTIEEVDSIGGESRPAKGLKESDYFEPPIPLYWTGYGNPAELRSHLMAVKAQVVMRMMADIIKPGDFCKLLVKRIMDECAELDLPPTVTLEPRRPLSTKLLMKYAKGVWPLEHACFDIKVFFDQWVYSEGYPELKCSFKFNQKKKITELSIIQKQARSGGLKFSGHILLRVHETTRSLEQLRAVTDEKHEFEFICTSRLRRNRKRKVVEEIRIDLHERLERNIDTPVQWIRADPLILWLCPVIVDQTEVMWVYQLEKDKSVIAQYEAVEGLRRKGEYSKLITLAVLQSTLVNPKIYHRVRAKAAEALATPPKNCRAQLGNEPFDILVKAFQKEFYEDGILKPNDFSNFSDYFLKMAIPLALSEMRDHRSELTPPEVQAFILGLLENNDNSRNPYSDSKYLASLIQCLGNMKVKSSQGSSIFGSDEDVEAIWSQLKRYLHNDQIMPSYQNYITQACLETLTKLEISQQLRSKVQYQKFAVYGNSRDVRVMAFKCMAVLAPNNTSWLPILLTLLEQEDPTANYITNTILSDGTWKFEVVLPDSDYRPSISAAASSRARWPKEIYTVLQLNPLLTRVLECIDVAVPLYPNLQNLQLFWHNSAELAEPLLHACTYTVSIFVQLHDPPNNTSSRNELRVFPLIVTDFAVLEPDQDPEGGAPLRVSTVTRRWEGERRVVKPEREEDSDERGDKGWVRLEWTFRHTVEIAPLHLIHDSTSRLSFGLIVQSTAVKGIVSGGFISFTKASCVNNCCQQGKLQETTCACPCHKDDKKDSQRPVITVSICAPQLEPKTYASPWTRGYRPASYGVRFGMAQVWAETFSENHKKLEVFRQSTPLNREFVDRLWRMLHTGTNPRFRYEIFKLYRILWGTTTPACCSPEIHDLGIKLRELYKKGNPACDENGTRQKKEVSRSSKRRQKARTEQRKRRDTRVFGTHSMDTTGKIKIQLKGNKFKASEAHDGEHEEL